MEKNPEDKTFAELFMEIPEEEQDILFALVDKYEEIESYVVEDWYDLEENDWQPSCAMDCELCGCHGDCPDCDTEGEYEDD